MVRQSTTEYVASHFPALAFHQAPTALGLYKSTHLVPYAKVCIAASTVDTIISL